MANPLIKIMVRAKKDRDAVEATIRTFYKDWDNQIEVVTMGGARKYDDVVNRIEDEAHNFEGIVVVLYARELNRLKDYKDYPINVRLSKVDKAKIRNARISEIYWAIEKGKALFRLHARWLPDEHAYVHFSNLGSPIKISCKPTYDLYYAVGKKHKEMFQEISHSEIGNNPLVIKYDQGVHEVYQGDVLAMRILIPYEYTDEVKLVGKGEYIPIDTDIDACVDLNNVYLKFLENFAFKIFELARTMTNYDRVVVPWSGGKDSTASLILALKYFKKDDIVPIFVDTLLDFPQNKLYVDEIAEQLNIDYMYVKADLATELKHRGVLPTKDNRWCTRVKLNALYNAIQKVSDEPIIIIGDRDSESLLRLKRPFIRWHEGMLQVAPIKIWSSALVQLYLFKQGIRLNPLYELGFYRLGCYICPAFRSWERMILEKYFKEFAKYRKCFSTPI